LIGIDGGELFDERGPIAAERGHPDAVREQRPDDLLAEPPASAADDRDAAHAGTSRLSKRTRPRAWHTSPSTRKRPSGSSQVVRTASGEGTLGSRTVSSSITEVRALFDRATEEEISVRQPDSSSAAAPALVQAKKRPSARRSPPDERGGG